MSWRIAFTKKAQKQIDALEANIRSRIKKSILQKLSTNPDLYLEPLSGVFGEFYKFRVGDYRLICSKENEKLVIIVVEVGHRREVYNN